MIISNNEFEVAYDNIDNQKIMRAACKKYKMFLDSDVLHGCRLNGLWKCLIYHKSHDTEVKFTTSLYNYVKWECQKEIEKKIKNRQTASLDVNSCIISGREPDERMGHVTECMRKLPADEQNLIKHRYIDGMTLQEIGVVYNISKETVRHRINKAVKKLKTIATH